MTHLTKRLALLAAASLLAGGALLAQAPAAPKTVAPASATKAAPARTPGHRVRHRRPRVAKTPRATPAPATTPHKG